MNRVNAQGDLRFFESSCNTMSAHPSKHGGRGRGIVFRTRLSKAQKGGERTSRYFSFLISHFSMLVVYSFVRISMIPKIATIPLNILLRSTWAGHLGSSWSLLSVGETNCSQGRVGRNSQCYSIVFSMFNEDLNNLNRIKIKITF